MKNNCKTCKFGVFNANDDSGICCRFPPQSYAGTGDGNKPHHFRYPAVETTMFCGCYEGVEAKQKAETK